MEPFRLAVNEKSMEYLEYKDASFPLGFWYDDYDTMPGSLLPIHWHQSIEIITVISGELDYFVKGIPYRLSAGDSFFVNLNQLHRTKANAEGTLVYGLIFMPSLLGYSADGLLYREYMDPVVRSAPPAISFSANTEDGKRMREAIHKLRALSSRDFYFDLDCFSVFLEIWREILQASSLQKTEHPVRDYVRHEEEIRNIIIYIKEHYMENLSISDIISHANLSRSECFRSFKQVTGSNPMEFINDFRLNQAASLLSSTDQNITEIAAACGFNSSSYFGKLFKEKYGQAPLRFRQFMQEKYKDGRQQEAAGT